MDCFFLHYILWLSVGNIWKTHNHHPSIRLHVQPVKGKWESYCIRILMVGRQEERNGHQVDHQAGKKWHPTKIIPHSVMPPPPMLLRKSISGIIRAFPFVPAAIILFHYFLTELLQNGHSVDITIRSEFLNSCSGYILPSPDLKWKCSLNLLWVYMKKYIKLFAIFVVS